MDMRDTLEIERSSATRRDFVGEVSQAPRVYADTFSLAYSRDGFLTAGGRGRDWRRSR